ncbi:MAG: hydroxyacid dehydrogenase [Gallicola sp.]|nr:hydroxyacid dehydrogenase [Gallicola sp.]
MKKAAFMMHPAFFEDVYSEETRSKIGEQVSVDLPLITDENINEYREELKSVEFVFSGWGAPLFDEALLDQMPSLKVIFYAAGTVRQVVTPEVWNRGIRVTTASTINAIPVSQFTLATILFSLKNGWQLMRKVRKEKTFENGVFQPSLGIYQATIGLVSMSSIGRDVADLLAPFGVNILAYDPFVSQEEADRYNVKMVSLEELFEESDIVSVHTPLLDATRHMIGYDLIASMKELSTLINTARGAIIKEDEMIQVLQERPDLTAVLDVTDPEPPLEDSPLYTLENVVLTPHIAGSVGGEKKRLGDSMLAEVKRYQEAEELDYEITEESYKNEA